MDINDLTLLFERFIPQIAKPLAKIADDTARIADHLRSEAGRDRATSLAQLGKVEDNRHLDDFLSSVTLEEINNTFLPKGDIGIRKGGPQNFDETLLTMSIKDILAKERKDIVIKRSDRDMCLGEPGLKNLLVKIVQYYCNQQKDLDTKGSEAGNLTKLLLNSTLVKSFNLATKDINLIHKQTLEHMQSNK